jgi:hypothetical protein
VSNIGIMHQFTHERRVLLVPHNLTLRESLLSRPPPYRRTKQVLPSPCPLPPLPTRTPPPAALSLPSRPPRSLPPLPTRSPPPAAHFLPRRPPHSLPLLPPRTPPPYFFSSFLHCCCSPLVRHPSHFALPSNIPLQTLGNKVSTLCSY